ncbi:hypothetical protein VOLCADRAFT_82983 [Volvox carteri f. nagariensis]|uniref:Presenilin n=1 Tax=Volvox carteri f. nagariensis TaxID=3068 RepID=D8U867_VOLCA|nr:uncharacterized protein VOLCADRAFT_82983 [Volvox carteri f. nagariensis]EFJ44036.1 hypothetical protein VOLCADRAFT_82983 [Volvox carteri f. nagariensis]|eukprot:XP_002954837.1 hypothetical protein VOLCADRAFT_82983 [Volvox carteri f. nagariensis]
MAARPSLLDNLGEEVTGIVAPVSLCMAVTVLLVRLLNPEGSSSSSSVLIANIAYQEQATDSSGKKLGGALLNAIIFVAVIGGMTILLFLLFKYKCYKFIYAYMGFAVFNIFFFLTGALFIQVMQVIKLHIDAFSLAYGLLNFSVVGTMGLLFVPIPLLMKQLYLIWVGIIVAYIFTWIPEWTAWVILVLMALYDIAAVLIPGGPLKALVEMAIERKQDLPALVYEARPAGGRPYVRGQRRVLRRGRCCPWRSRRRWASSLSDSLLTGQERRRDPLPIAVRRRGGRDTHTHIHAFEVDLPDAIKLGLGDFIFYSMLVGRAAMYDFMTVFSAYLAIIAGLGLTLLCLAIYQKALPALPFSIALGVAFYFLTRLTLEPFLVPMSTHLTYF